MTIKKKLLTLKYTFKSIIEKKNISNATVELHSQLLVDIKLLYVFNISIKKLLGETKITQKS